MKKKILLTLLIFVMMPLLVYASGIYLHFNDGTVDNEKLIIGSLGPGTTADSLMGDVDTNATEKTIVDMDGALLDGTTKLKTGDKIKLVLDTNTLEYAISVKGDVLGIGNINSSSVLKTAKHIIDKNVITGEEYLDAADYNNDGNIKMNDAMMMIRDMPEESKIAVPKVYTSDNIGSGETHPVRFMIKLTSEADKIYYCEDTDNTCVPTTEYTEQIVIPKSMEKYIRYQACDSDGNCSSVESYHVICYQVGGTVGSQALWNAYGAAHYRQGSSSWSTVMLPGGKYNMAQAGCGYTSFAMLMTGITNDYSITPVTILNDLKNNTTGYYYDDSESLGMLFHSALWKDYMVKKYKYGVDRIFFNFSSVPEENVSQSIAKSKIVESLKMGHMIFMLTPNHYIALVGMQADGDIMVFDPNRQAEYRTITSLHNFYEDFQLAYEIYPQDGISLKKWNEIK